MARSCSRRTWPDALRPPCMVTGRAGDPEVTCRPGPASTSLPPDVRLPCPARRWSHLRRASGSRCWSFCSCHSAELASRLPLGRRCPTGLGEPALEPCTVDDPRQGERSEPCARPVLERSEGAMRWQRRGAPCPHRPIPRAAAMAGACAEGPKAAVVRRRGGAVFGAILSLGRGG